MQNNPFISTNQCRSDRAAATKPRLFCFPYAGAGAAAFRDWTGQLFSKVEVVPVCLPGREQRFMEQAETDMASLVRLLAEEMATELTGEFAFFGISAGAMLAFELASYLEQQGLKLPSQLFVACCDAPHLEAIRPQIHHLQDDELLEEVVRRYGDDGVDMGEMAEMRSLMLPVLRADIKLAEQYRGTHRDPLDIPITTFGATNDASVSPAGLAQWQGLTRGSHRMHWVDGGHFLRNCEREISTLIGTTINPQWSVA